jgi:type I restriction enzyme, R subunit
MQALKLEDIFGIRQVLVKHLTSFKTAQLASKLPYVDKVLFVVDRKDLDYQTMKEYDRFEKGAADSNHLQLY